MNETKKTFPIKGMHCASCVRVLERALKKVPGVEDAVVNLATEKATVYYNSAINPQALLSAVSNVGYKAVLEDERVHEDIEKKEKEKELKNLRFKVIVSIGLGLIILWGSFPGLM